MTGRGGRPCGRFDEDGPSAAGTPDVGTVPGVTRIQPLPDRDERARMLNADMAEPDGVLGNGELPGLIDPCRSLVPLMVDVLHFAPQRAGRAGIVRRCRDAPASGSVLAQPPCTANVGPDEMDGVVQVMRSSADPIHPRSHGEISELHDGFYPVGPGVVATGPRGPATADTVVGQPAARAHVGVGRRS